jgi:phosphosulfolactate synthase
MRPGRSDAVEYALSGVMNPPLAGRTMPPRTHGVTMIMDKGIGLRQTADLIESAGRWIDYWKLPFGSAFLYPESVLREKVSQIVGYGIVCYPGGTAMEIALNQGRFGQFLDWVEGLGMNGVEVSDGTTPLEDTVRRQCIRQAAAAGFRVVSEIGKKDGSRFDPALFWHLVRLDREAGSEQVIVEGRESGRGVGIYTDSGAIDPDELGRLVEGADDPANLLWEAPEKGQQEELIRRFGVNVGLGNVPPAEVLALESLRQGLRSDTFRIALEAAAVRRG